jgi:predicted transcriptional regulator
MLYFLSREKEMGSIKDRVVSVRIDGPTLDSLRVLAESERRTVANVVTIAIEDFLAARERPTKRKPKP